jgi:hypothetical protein
LGAPCYTSQRRLKGYVYGRAKSDDGDRRLHREIQGDHRSGANREYIAETLGVLQTDNTEEDAFNMLGSAIVEAVADDPARTEALFGVWSELEEQRKLS